MDVILSGIKTILFRLQLLVPVLLIGMALGELFFEHDLWTDREQLYWRFFVNVVLINSLHVAIMFLYMALIPNFRSWYRQSKRTMFYSHGTIWFLFFLIMIGAQILREQKIDFLSDLIGVGLIGYAAFHTLRQSFGISLLLNKSRFLHKESSKRYSEKFERSLVWSLLSLLLLPLFLKKFTLIQSNFIENEISLSCAALMVALNMFLIFLTAIEIEEKRLLKCIYGLRYLIYPLSLFSFIGAVGIGAIHGVEYMLVAYHLMFQSKLKSFIFDSLTYCAMFLFLGVFVLSLTSGQGGILTLIFGGGETYDMFSSVGSIFLGAVVYVHYYIEGQIFMFSNQTSREQIAPLFRGI